MSGRRGTKRHCLMRLARHGPRAGGLAIAALLVLAPLFGVAAQVGLRDAGQMGRVTIRLVDSATGAPIVQAFLELSPTGHRALTDSTGTASFLQLPPGTHTLSVRHIAYGQHEISLEAEGMTTSVLAIELEPSAIAVEPLEVQVERRPRHLEDSGFYTRRAVGWGTYFDPAFVDRWGIGTWASAPRFIHLLGDFAPKFQSNRPSCIGVPLQVYVDGHLRIAGLESLETVSTWDIGAVEMYSGTTGLPEFALGPDAACGMIAIWSNTWRGRARKLGGGDVALCEPEEDGTVVVEGFIRDEFTDVLLPGAHVIATSYPADDTRTAKHRRFISDRFGRYRVCDVPPDHTLTVFVEVANRGSQEHHVSLEGPLVHHDLTVRVSGPGDVVGRVFDRATGRPVAAADIHVRETGERAQTDALGYFRLDEILPGDHTIDIAHLGFEPLTETVSVVGDRTVELRIELSADPVALEPLIVTVLRDRRLQNRGYYDRRTWGERTGLGTFMEAEAIDRQVAGRTSSLLQTVAGLRVTCSGSRNCLVGTSRVASCRQMSVYINGSLALGEGRRDPVSIDELVRPSDIEALEIYPGAGSVPAEFSGTSGRCGAIVIWTR